MPPNPPSDVANTRDGPVSHPNSSCSRRKRPGRPNQGIRSGYVRVEVYLSPDVRQGLDRLVRQRAQQKGQFTPRAALIREALAMYLRHAAHQET